ncbi:MAG: hypothetical protein J6V14_05845 [Clostridia bacterium]|nr:hypothetical protein [Clostridia bacterium]
MNKRIMNIVNFVRGCEPREPEKDLVLPVAEELKVNRKYGLKSTVLLQYDALLREDMVSLFADGPKDVELGLWFEMNRQLTEAVGIPWRGRPGYDWDWYVNPGFLPAYTPAQREALIDEAFRKFHEMFGYYPKSAGSWLLDAHSMRYMSEKYALDALCICREQYAVDAYTLWGGYYNGAYYPSTKNALCPASTPENQIDTPVFRMLGIDPIYGYDEAKYPTGVWGCNTLEPVWTSGSDPRIVNWYMDVYYKTPFLNYSHATTGQENSFGWGSIGPGYKVQADTIARMRDSGALSVEFLGETGHAFKAAYRVTPCTALVADKDRTDNKIRSLWYNSPSYRAGVVLEPGGRLYIRSLDLYDERYEERYLTEPCSSWDARYDNLAVVDNRLWSKGEFESAIEIDPAVNHKEFTVETDGKNELILNSGVSIIRLTPDKIVFNNVSEIGISFGTPDDGRAIKSTSYAAASRTVYEYSFRGSKYGIELSSFGNRIELRPILNH